MCVSFVLGGMNCLFLTGLICRLQSVACTSRINSDHPLLQLAYSIRLVVALMLHSSLCLSASGFSCSTRKKTCVTVDEFRGCSGVFCRVVVCRPVPPPGGSFEARPDGWRSPVRSVLAPSSDTRSP